MFEWYNTPEETRIQYGIEARQYLIDNKMSAIGMCDNVITDITSCLENFEPKERFTLLKLTK
jgi:hypothetical protein